MIAATFLTQFPEFVGSPAGMIQAYLDAALLEMDLAIWGPTGGTGQGQGTLADQGQGYLAAHKLTLSPFGQNARLIMKDGTTTYWKHYSRLVYSVACGYGKVT